MKNFKVKDNNIDVEHFVEFFIKETKQEDMTLENLRKVYLSRKAEQL